MANSTIVILSGIPTSGKSKFSVQKAFVQSYYYNKEVIIISRDVIRLELFGLNYKQNTFGEKRVTAKFNEDLDRVLGASYAIDKFSKELRKDYSLQDYYIIIDNTSCKESYIDAFITTIKGKNPLAKIEIKFFDLPLWKAFVRNIRRKITTGKYIPWKVIKNMKKSYDKINRNKYHEYLVH